MLGLGDVAGVRRVDHDDAAPGGLGDVDPLDVHSRPGDDLQIGARREDGGVHGSTGTDDERVAAGHAAQHLGLVPAGAGLHGQSCAEELLDDLGGEIVEDDHSLLVAHLAASREEGRSLGTGRTVHRSGRDGEAEIVRRDCVQG